MKVRIIYAKTCPFCKILMENVFIPLSLKFSDLLYLDIKEVYPKFMLEQVLVPGGQYHTTFNRTPEIYIDDKVIIISFDKESILKFYRDFANRLYDEASKKLHNYRLKLLQLELRRIYKRLLELDIEKYKH